MPEEPRWERLGAFIQDNQWILSTLGILGNLAFLVGSVMFLSDALQRAGTWLFIFGSAGMLLDSLARIVMQLRRRAREKSARA